MKNKKYEKLSLLEGEKMLVFFANSVRSGPSDSAETPGDSEAEPEGYEDLEAEPGGGEERQEVSGEVADEAIRRLEEGVTGDCQELEALLDGLGVNDKELTLTGLGEAEEELSEAFSDMFENLQDSEGVELKDKLGIDNYDQLVELYTSFTKLMIEARDYPEFFSAYNEASDEPIEPEEVEYRIVLDSKGMKDISIVSPSDLDTMHQHWVENERDVEDTVDRFKSSRIGSMLLSIGLVDEGDLRGVLSGRSFNIITAVAAIIVLGRDAVGGIFGEALSAIPEQVREPFDNFVDNARSWLEEREFLDRGVKEVSTSDAFDGLIGNSLNEDLLIDGDIDLGEDVLAFDFSSGDRKIEVPSGRELRLMVDGVERNVRGVHEIGTEEDSGVERVLLTGTIPRGTFFSGISRIERGTA